MEHDDFAVNRGRLRGRRAAEWWAGLIDAQATSGASLVAFCRERGVAVSTFYAWRRRLCDERAGSAAERGFVRLRVGGGDSTERATCVDRGNVDAEADPSAGPNPRDVAADLSVATDDRDGVPASSTVDTLVVRFADGVELHVPGDRLGEVLTQLRSGSPGGTG